MSRRSVLALGILLALSFIAAGWWLVEREAPAPPPAPTGSTASPEAPRADAARLDEASEPPSSPAGAPESRSDRRAPEGIWIRGRVRIPEGFPRDDHVEVAARYVSLDDESAGVSGLDEEGRFGVAFPADAESGWLELRSRYLYLEHEVDVDLEDPPEEVVLEPELGGCVRGRLVPSRPAVDLAGTRVEMFSGAQGSSDGTCLRASIVGSDLGFEMTAVPPRANYALSVEPLSFLPERRSIEVDPGSTTEVLLDLHTRARVSGRVLDPEGDPVPQAHITWVEPREWRFAGKTRPEAWTSDDGSFSLASARPGPSTLLVQHREYLPERREIVPLQDGQDLGSLEIRLRSARISGVVRWPDGRPVESCEVRLSPRSPRALAYGCGMPTNQVRSIADWPFSFIVDSEGPFHLSVRTNRPNALQGDGETGFAKVDGIRPGQAPLTVILRSASTIRGKVVDDLGHPVERFSIEASATNEAPAVVVADSVSARFQAEDGAFALGGLADGEWMLVASDEWGVSGPESGPIAAPGSALVVLVVPRAAELTGVVLEPSGAPAPFADVEPSSGPYSTTDASGRFRLTHVDPGSVSLTASSKSWAHSLPLNVAAKPGETIVDLVLQLRRGGRIAGTVFDADGREERDAYVSVSNADESFVEGFSSDAEGQFETGWLAPGSYIVSCTPHRDQGVDTERTEVPEQVSVTVVEDRVTSVAFGRPR